MGICWYCHWGWPKEIRGIYDRAAADIDKMMEELVQSGKGDFPEGSPYNGENALEYGPAHCVWADENFSGDFAFELKECDSDRYSDWPQGIMKIVRRSLEELKALPDESKEPPQEYCEFLNDDPQNYPPPPGWEMVKR